MASFQAELEVSGCVYPVRNCYFEFSQATSERGRAAAKVRHGLVHLTLDVPDDDVLLDWGNTPHKPLPGHVTFFDTGRHTARETLAWEAGQCVGYHETFVSGDGAAGAYVCNLVVSATRLELTAGGPLREMRTAAAREHKSAAVSTPIAVPPGNGIVSDCTESIHQNLQNQVKQNCKSGKQSCLIYR